MIVKGSDHIVREFILIIHEKSEVYRVYAKDKSSALKTFLSACDKYSDTDNADYNAYWCDIKKQVISSNITILESEDFLGVRKIV